MSFRGIRLWLKRRKLAQLQQHAKELRLDNQIRLTKLDIANEHDIAKQLDKSLTEKGIE